MLDDLKARYGEARLPRYTSYPTAPHFSDAVSAGTYAGWLAGLTPGTTASLYVHIPFCKAMCWYCGCNTTVASRPEPVRAYLDALRREIDLVAGHVPAGIAVRHLHFGGGTPTIVAPEDFLALTSHLRERFAFGTGAEIAVEIDPRTLTPEMTRALGEAGVTRASLGVQSFDRTVQAAINRHQHYAETARATHDLRASGVTGINFDLIYGLPHQTTASCRDTVRRCLDLGPDRFSVFGYAHVPSFKKHQRKIDEAALPAGPARYEQEQAIGEVLVEAGYVRIGLDHFALPDDLLAVAQGAGRVRRNFQGYTTDPCDVLIGLGASAISRLGPGYAQNETVIGRYAERVAKAELPVAKGCALTPDDRLRADVIERIMCDFSVDLGEICRKHDASPDHLLASATKLPALATDGVIRFEGETLVVNDGMRSLVRAVAASFDARLGASPRTHSRAL